MPLSRALCCRVCSPQQEQVAALVPPSIETFPLQLLTTNCYVQTDGSPSNLTCSSGALVGYTDARQLSYTNQYYGHLVPVGPILCCSAMLLMPDYMALQVLPCECTLAEGVNCSDDKVVAGHVKSWSSDGLYVPAGDAVCCGLCVTGTLLTEESTCGQGDKCNGHGLCLLGLC